MTTSSDSGPLAALLGRSLAADDGADRERRTAPRPRNRLSDFGGGSPSPSPCPAAPPRAALLAGACPGAGTGTPNPNRNRLRPRPPATAPEAGPIKHVFVVSLASPGYDAAFGSDARRCPTWRRRCGPRATCSPTTRCSTRRRCRTRSRRQRPAARRAARPKADCPRSTARCVYPVETLTVADQLGRRQVHLARLHGGHGRPETGKPDNCVYPQPGAAELDRRRAATRPGSTPSPTSTRCSTSATARSTTCR